MEDKKEIIISEENLAKLEQRLGRINKQVIKFEKNSQPPRRIKKRRKPLDELVKGCAIFTCSLILMSLFIYFVMYPWERRESIRMKEEYSKLLDKSKKINEDNKELIDYIRRNFGNKIN